MATPCAVLSVLVSADTEKATAQLSKFDRQLQATSDVARKGIEARMDGRFNGEAFTKYEAALEARVDGGEGPRRVQGRARRELQQHGVPRAYQRGVDQANKSTKEASKHTDGLTRSFKGLTSSLLAAGGAFAAFEVAKEAITCTLELGHATERLSAVTGLGVKQASTWIETMKVRGVQTKAVGMAFITLSRNVRHRAGRRRRAHHQDQGPRRQPEGRAGGARGDRRFAQATGGIGGPPAAGDGQAERPEHQQGGRCVRGARRVPGHAQEQEHREDSAGRR